MYCAQVWYVKKASDLGARFYGTSAAERPGPVESRLAAFGTVRPMVVGQYGELSPFFEELIDAAADSGAGKHWRRMRSDPPAVTRGFIVQMLRRSWGMAAFRANARLVTRRLQHIRGTAVPMSQFSLNLTLLRLYSSSYIHIGIYESDLYYTC